MDESAFYIDEILETLAKGAARADFAAHLEAAQTWRELAREIGPEAASLYARDWRLEQRTVRMQVRVELARSTVDGLLRIFIKARATQVEGQTLEVEDRFAASGLAALSLDGAPGPTPTPAPFPEAPPEVPDALRNDVQKLLLKAANAEELDRAREKGLAVGDRFHEGWRMLQRQVLRRLGWAEDPPPKWPTPEVLQFLKTHGG
jgi:hypothetical protein